MNSPLLLTVSAAAELMGLSRWTVQALCRRGPAKRGLSFIPLGRIHKRIPRSEVDRWIRDNMVSSAKEHIEAVKGLK